MKVRKVHYIPTAWLSARYGYTTACTRNPDGVETTNDVTQTTCGSCMKRSEYRRDMITAARAVAETPVCTISNECAVCLGGGICPDRCATCGGTNSRECRTHDSILLVDVETAKASDESAKSAIVADLLDRALFLGYDDQAAADLADCLDVPHTYEPCPDHPGHSTTMDKWGYAVDECEACKVLRMSTETGYTVTAMAERRESARVAHVEYLNEVIMDGSAVGICVCWAITERGASELHQGGEVCMGCGSVFTREDAEPSGVVTALSDYVVRRRGGITGTPEQLTSDLNALACAHWANVTSTDPTRSDGSGTAYLGSQADLRMAFEDAYPGMVWDVFVEIMCDNMPTDNIVSDIERIRQTMPNYLETGDRHGTPVTGDQGPDLPDLPQAPCIRARLEHAATLASDATYAAAHDRTLMAMCRAYIRGHKNIHRTAVATGYTVALIDYVRIAFPDLTQEQVEMVVCEALADACADLAD